MEAVLWMRYNHRLFNMRCLRFRLYLTICVLHELQTDPKMCRGRNLLRTWHRGPTAKTAPFYPLNRCGSALDAAALTGPQFGVLPVEALGPEQRCGTFKQRNAKGLSIHINDKTGYP